MKHALRFPAILIAAAALAACALLAPEKTPVSGDYDVIIRNGTIYDGSGKAPFTGDVLVSGGRIVAVGKVPGAKGRQEVDVHGLAVAPGFVNMLSWAVDSLIVNGIGQSDLRQGVTLEVFGEGWSMGPLNDKMKEEAKKDQSDYHYDVDWTTLGEYLDSLVRRGISMNVASMVGAATVRIHEIGEANRAPNADELARMQALVRQAMEEGALGVGSALIYAPGNYAKTDELKALVGAAAPYGGGYISHMRSEGDQFLEALDELIDISRATGAPPPPPPHAELYHMKAAGHDNWPKMAQAIKKVDQARAEGLPISANMYTYTAGGTGLDACMDPAVKEGGTDAWIERLKKPEVRAKVVDAVFKKAVGWENICYASGTPDRILLAGFKEEKLKPLTGKTLAEVAKMRGKSPSETVVDLCIEDHTRVGTIFFLMTEENVKLGLSQPWVALGSDEGAIEPSGPFLKSNPHPRAYGTFARFLGKYVRDEKVATLQDAVRRLSALPADNWHLTGRGHIAPGYAADIVVFDPVSISDHATFEKPHAFATGVKHVWVNGVQALKDGEPTGAKPGQVVRGPGYRAH
jgi:N-acyl-D-amino-acid deacylase